MANSPFGPYADLSRYVERANQPVVNPLDALIGGFQSGQAIRNLPQTLAQNALEQQLATAITQAKLAELQRPKTFNVGGVGLVVEDPTSPGGFRTVVPIPTRTTTAATMTKVPGLKSMNFVEPDGTTHAWAVDIEGNKLRDLGVTKAAPIPKSTSKSTGSTGSSTGLKPTGEHITQFASGLSLLGQINDTIKTAEEAEKSGKFPNEFQSGLNQFLARRPQDIPGANLIPGFDSAFAVTQRLSRGLQTKESADLQKRKAMITSQILRTQAGLSQTLGEAINIAPYVPNENDTYESLIEKLRLTQNEGKRALRITRRIFPQLAQIEAPELEDGTSDTSETPPSSDTGFSSEAEARAKGHKTGDIVIIGGVVGRLK